jgi:hypothetical protein
LLIGLQHRFAVPKRSLGFYPLRDFLHQGVIHIGKFLGALSNPYLEIIVGPLQRVFRSSLMQEKQYRQPDGRQTKEPVRYAHPEGDPVECGAQNHVGHRQHGTDGGGDDRPRPIRQQER